MAKPCFPQRREEVGWEEVGWEGAVVATPRMRLLLVARNAA